MNAADKKEIRSVDELAARDLLENAVAMSAALLDSVAAMLEIQATVEGQLEILPETASGIRQLAEEQSSNLRNRFKELCEAGRARATASNEMCHPFGQSRERLRPQ